MTSVQLPSGQLAGGDWTMDGVETDYSFARDLKTLVQTRSGKNVVYLVQ